MADEPNANAQAPLNPDLMGYPDVQSLVAAKRAGDAEAKRLFEENRKKDELLAQLISSGAAGNPRQPIPDRSQRPEDELTQFGIPIGALDQYVDRKMAQVLMPLQQTAQARQRIVAKHPDYLQFEHEVAAFIEQDPDLSASYWPMAKADPVGAMEYAFLKFGADRRRAVNGAEGPPPQGRTDAGIPTSRAGDGRRAPGEDAQLQDAMDRFQRSGSSRDARAYAEARLAPLLEQQFQRAGQTLGPQP